MVFYVPIALWLSASALNPLFLSKKLSEHEINSTRNIQFLFQCNRCPNSEIQTYSKWISHAETHIKDKQCCGTKFDFPTTKLIHLHSKHLEKFLHCPCGASFPSTRSQEGLWHLSHCNPYCKICGLQYTSCKHQRSIIKIN